MKVSMTLTIDYDIGDEKPVQAMVQISDLLSYAAQYMASNGLMTGDGPLTVNEWECLVDTVED